MTIDWELIKKDYEQGFSLRTLSAKFGVGKSTIHDRSVADEWTRPSVVRTLEPDSYRTAIGHRTPAVAEQPPDVVTVSLARAMVAQLATIAKVPLDLKEQTMFAQALNQYNKIMVTAPTPEQNLPNGVDWSIFTQDELSILQPIFAQAEERAQEKRKQAVHDAIRRA